jgi:hypothetical protein
MSPPGAEHGAVFGEPAMPDQDDIIATQQARRALEILRGEYRMHPGDKVALSTLEKTWQYCRYPVSALRTEIEILARKGWAEVTARETVIRLTERGAEVTWPKDGWFASTLHRLNAPLQFRPHA